MVSSYEIFSRELSEELFAIITEENAWKKIALKIALKMTVTHHV